LSISYNAAVVDSRIQAERVGEFLDRPVDLDRMAAAVDSRLYRVRLSNRSDLLPRENQSVI
jgi:hypothetical protein